MTTAATDLQDAGTHGDLPRTYNPFVPPQHDDPFRGWERARHQAPMFFSEVQRAWIVTRYADICAVLAHPQRFSSADAIRPSLPPPPEVQAALDEGHAYDEIPAMVNLDPPVHTRIRKFIAAALSPQRVAAMETRTWPRRPSKKPCAPTPPCRASSARQPKTSRSAEHTSPPGPA
jgi:cytochrome P450